MMEDDPQRIEHIDIGKETDLFLVAPASANTIAKLAMGLADNMVTSTALALPQRTKKLLAPAIEYKNARTIPHTQRNLKLLQDYGYQMIQPRDAVLACGDKGAGALATVELLLKLLRRIVYEKVIFYFTNCHLFCGDDHHSLCDILHSAICSIRNSTNLGSYSCRDRLYHIRSTDWSYLRTPHGTL